MKIGIIREGKIPQDNRTPLTPSQCRTLMEEHSSVWIAVQPCRHRCFSDDEYRYQGIAVREDLSDCDLLLGVKEVPLEQLMANKTYMFFSHTIKKQPHNRTLLQEVLKKKIRLIDYECLKDEQGQRLIAFGRWAGIVGAYHAIKMIGHRTGNFSIPQMVYCHNFAEAQKSLEHLQLPNWKIVLTGTGRVANGSAFLLDTMGIQKVSAHDFCYKTFDKVVYTQLESKDMFYRPGAETFDTDHFHAHPEEYLSAFYPFTKVADVFINGIYWDQRIAPFFTKAQMKEPDFAIKIISDITCDIAPESSVPSTLMASSIADPYYGYDAQEEKITGTFTNRFIDIQAIDNLPNELPRDASEDFGNMLLSRIIPRLMRANSQTIDNATIAVNGSLGKNFSYLEDYASGV
ncbi:MAG: NAD(P)-dependent oxidoreductase [Chitinophagales bacterium]